MQSFGYDTREFLKVYHVSVACLGMCGYSSVVEHLVAIENVARSTRVTRFENCRLTPRFVPGIDGHLCDTLKNGKVAEWSNAPVLKTGVVERLPRVRLPLFPWMGS
jgi:hypothetical protein